MTRGLGIVVLLAGVLPGCSALRAINPFDSPPTFSNTQFVGYVAIDPISLPAAAFGAKAKERGDHDPNLDALSNNAARIAMQEITQDGEAKYVASSLSYKGNYYKATIDYIKYYSFGTTIKVKRGKVAGPQDKNDEQDIPIGVAVGVGLRAEAAFLAIEGKANIADIVNIGVSAQSKQISGTLSFQALGIESKAITDTLPIPSELSASSIQSALQAIVTVKANIYGKDTRVVPQIVGIEILTHGDGLSINDILRAVHENRTRIAEQVKEEMDHQGIKLAAE